MIHLLSIELHIIVFKFFNKKIWTMFTIINWFFVYSEWSHDRDTHAKSSLLEDNARSYGRYRLVQRQLFDGARARLGEKSGMQFRYEILQGMDIYQIISAVTVSTLRYSAKMNHMSLWFYENIKIFQRKIDTSFLQQSETGSVADWMYGRSEISGLV